MAHAKKSLKKDGNINELQQFADYILEMYLDMLEYGNDYNVEALKLKKTLQQIVRTGHINNQRILRLF